MKSIIQNKKECYVCHTTFDIHDHHIFEGTGRRKQSEKYGLKVYLCAYHHNMSDEGVHFNKKLDLKLKKIAQRKFELTHTRKEFLAHFIRNYLD